MDEGSARVRLEAMTQSVSFPALTEDELAELVTIAKRTDVDGALPSDAAWVPTWDLNAAAALGWAWKAAKVVAHFPFSTDGQRFDRQYIHQQCMEQSRFYAFKVQGTISFHPVDPLAEVVVN